MLLSRFWVLPLFVACAFAACSEPDSASSSSSAGAGAGGESASTAGASSAGDSGVIDGAGEGPVGSPGGASTGGAEGLAGQMAGGSPGAGGEPGGGGTVCMPPPVAPGSGSACPAACEGELVAYEDCDGDGFLQVACATDWFVVQSACGDHVCQEPAFAGQSCSAGQVCALMQGGAQLPECRAHGCGTGPITCACLGEACPGCTQTGVLDFTCNTCPSGQCP